MSDVPANYLKLASQQTKNPVVVVQITGVPDLLVNTTVYRTLQYGDPVSYGDAGIEYGGLIPYVVVNADGSTSTFRPYLNLDGSSLTLGQRLEPEQGKASVSTLSLAFIDYQGYMTQLLTPGQIIPEILGAEVKVYLGFTQISYPTDFLQIFRGYISAVSDGPGNVILELSDPNIKRRQSVFYCAQTTLSSPALAGDTTLFVPNNASIFQQIVAASGASYPVAGPPYCHCYVKIDDEWIEMQPSGIDPTKLLVITRGARGTTAAAHSSGAQVTAAIQLGDSSNPQNAIDMALQIMLSGWAGPWISGVAMNSIGPGPDPMPSISYTEFLQLPAGVDAVATYNLVAGDYVILTGSATPANNNTYFQILRFAPDPVLGTPNNLIYFAPFTFVKEYPTTATVAFRSQYDVLPVEAGLKLTPKDVDIAQHQFIKNTFLGTPGNDLIFFITAQEDSGKNFLESQVYFPVGAYSMTRRGLLSCGYHSPPIGSQSLATLDSTNVLEPDKIRVTRALNQRAFFNEIDITYNYDDDGNSLSSLIITDSNTLVDPSLGGIGIVSALPIDARGIYGGYSATLLQKRAFFLLTRYKRGAVQFQVKVNWQAGSTIEVGDIVTFDDKGTLQIANFQTGQRGIDNQLFEVIDRTFDLRQGNVSLKLVGGVGSTLQDRFATISPSSLTDAGCTTTQLIIKDSFGALYPGNESKKWENYIGLPLLVHSPDYSTSYTCTLLSIDPINNYMLHVSTMGGTPTSGFVVDIGNYPSSTDPTQSALYKLMHCFLTPMVLVTSGVDSSHFNVGAGDVSKFFVGAPIRVHSPDFTTDSDSASTSITVAGIVGTTIQVSPILGFTPTAGMQVDLLGFPDFNSSLNTGLPYRWL